MYTDERLRVLQVVTSFQRGGAERSHPRPGRRWVRGTNTVDASACVARGGQPFPIPPGTIDLSDLPNDKRHDALARLVQSFAIDVVHGHLLDRDECIRLAGLGVPLVLTVHNMPPAGRLGWADLRPGEAHLLLACSRAVDADLVASDVRLPVRTVWNGIDFSGVAASVALSESGRRWRERFGFSCDDFVLLSLANPRKQKGLNRLPGILAATREELSRRGQVRQARLVLAGIPPSSTESVQVVEEVRAEVERLGLQEHVFWAGAVEDVGGLLRASDVLVSSSLHEGLSLAQLEAVASGRPVVATNVGGLADLAHGNPAVISVPADSGPEGFAHALAEVLIHPPLDGRAAAGHFTRQHMAEHTAGSIRR